MANKTPFELRAEMLAIAFDVLSQRAQAEANDTERKRLESLSDPSYGTFSNAAITRIITTEEVVAEATKLNNFISRSADR